MVIRTAMLSGYGGLVWHDVSLPHVPCLVDGEKYREPDDLPTMDAAEQRRRHSQHSRGQRAPSLRYLVKLAVRACPP